MARLILLDSGPLGLIVRPPNKSQVTRCLNWLRTISATGATVLIPEIAHYEVRRELFRIRAVGSLRRLERYLDPSGGLIHLTLSTDAIIKAAEFWAFVRQTGIPTASPDALDADAILAGQAALAGQPGDTVTIAATNLAHLSRFPGIDAQMWDQIR
jgi:hypothetical protein